MTVPILDMAASLFVTLIGLKILSDSWLMLKHGKGVIFLPGHIALFLVRVLRGRDEAARLRAKNLTPEKIKQTGVYAFIGGVMTLAGGLILLFDSIARIQW